MAMNDSIAGKLALLLIAVLSLGASNVIAQTAASDDCSNGFLDRLGAAYREDMTPEPADPNAPTPPRRAMDSPFSSPPFPSSEWQLGGMDYPIGVPNGNAQYPLERALGGTALGQWMKDNRVEVYGWINPSANLGTSNFSNYPLSYATRPDRVEFDQFL